MFIGVFFLFLATIDHRVDIENAQRDPTIDVVQRQDVGI